MTQSYMFKVFNQTHKGTETDFTSPLNSSKSQVEASFFSEDEAKRQKLYSQIHMPHSSPKQRQNEDLSRLEVSSGGGKSVMGSPE